MSDASLSSKELVHWHDVLKRGGSWLAAARSAVQCSAVNGESIKWGSSEAVRGMTMRDVEELAARAVAAALNEQPAHEPSALRMAAERVRDHACAYKAPADSLLVKRELIFQLAEVLGGSITERPSLPPTVCLCNESRDLLQKMRAEHIEHGSLSGRVQREAENLLHRLDARTTPTKEVTP